MQRVEYTGHNIHPLFDELEQVYAYTSVREHKDNQLVMPAFKALLKPVFDTFDKYAEVNYRVSFMDVLSTPVDVFSIENIPKTIILCYSGGKDSTATAIWYKEHGYDVILYHLRNINQTYKDEWKNVQKMADKLGMTLIMQSISLKGKHDWVEHPLKNWIIANRALQYGISHHITSQIAFGNFTSSTLESDPFDVCGGDCKEMWSLYNNIIGTIIPGFEMHTPLTNMKDTLDILMEHKNIAVMCQSCIGPFRYRDYLGKNNRIKYNLDLPEHRCYSCWKCCLEYIVYTDNDIYEYNEEMYKHCLEILRNTIKKEQGLRISLDEVWDHYFFYDKSRSKYYG